MERRLSSAFAKAFFSYCCCLVNVEVAFCRVATATPIIRMPYLPRIEILGSTYLVAPRQPTKSLADTNIR